MNRYKRLFLLACLVTLGYSGSLGASDTAKEQRWADQIVGMLLDGEPVWLEAGDTEFLALHTEERTGEPRGAVILAHGIGVHPNWQEVIYPLRTRLPEHGWTTLSIQMPILENEAELADYAPLIPEAAPRIQAAVDYLQDRTEGPIILVGHSLGSIMGAAALAGADAPPVAGFAAIGMSSSDIDPHLNSIAHLEQLQLPVLDLYGSRDLESVLRTSDERARAARKAGNDNYRQVEVTGADHFFVGLEDELVRRVRGWLESAREHWQQQRGN